MNRYRRRLEELTPTLWRWWLFDSERNRMAKDGVETTMTWALAAADRAVAKLEEEAAPPPKKLELVT